MEKMNAELINDELGMIEILNPHTDKKVWVVFGDSKSMLDREYEIIGMGDSQDKAIKDALARCYDFRKNAAHKERIKMYLDSIFSGSGEDQVYLGCYPDNDEKDQVLPLYEESSCGDKYYLKICQSDNDDDKDQYCLLWA